mmetsp:Transcript_2383/g.3643  ORF Transcript_2383/g.3643 Transcript_2383/m.3643 type:complete len:160 (-) Transcript_2383:3030-3509(-)
MMNPSLYGPSTAKKEVSTAKRREESSTVWKKNSGSKSKSSVPDKVPHFQGIVTNKDEYFKSKHLLVSQQSSTNNLNSNNKQSKSSSLVAAQFPKKGGRGRRFEMNRYSNQDATSSSQISRHSHEQPALHGVTVPNQSSLPALATSKRHNLFAAQIIAST